MMYHTYDNMSGKNIREVYMYIYIYVHIISYDMIINARMTYYFFTSTSLLIRTLCIRVLCGDINILV